MAEKILVVDDDESLAGLCEVALRGAGYHVTLCFGGEEALRKLEEQSFDLVLTDQQMPGKINGRKIVLGVKARHPKTEAIVMTGEPTLENAIDTLKDGAYDYIVKPFHVDHLLAVIRRCLDHRQLREDLSSERALRRELESAYQELQKVERLKESFLARLSHELKTPLSEVLIAVSLLDESLPPILPAKEKENTERCLGIVKKGVDRLEQTISELLAFVDLQKTSLQSGTTEVNLEQVCQEAVRRLKPLWEPRRLNMALSFQPGTGPVIGDPALLTTAVEHLIHNAIVFNREGGSVTIAGNALEETIRMSIADTGEGIPESEFSNIFDSFYQIANYLTRKVEGLGLGLAITRRIIESHRGTVSVQSKLGVGTTFTILLPAAKKR